MYYIGIDPGRQGALCLLDLSLPNPLFLGLDPNKRNAGTIVAAILRKIAGKSNVHIALEQVHSLGGMSARSNFTFGGMYWRARTILDCLDVPYELVTPKAWQQAVGVPAKRDRDPGDNLKKLVAKMAFELYPSADLYGPRGGLKDGRSDALMIAHYLRLKHGG